MLICTEVTASCTSRDRSERLLLEECVVFCSSMVIATVMELH